MLMVICKLRDNLPSSFLDATFVERLFKPKYILLHRAVLYWYILLGIFLLIMRSSIDNNNNNNNHLFVLTIYKMITIIIKLV